MKHSYRKQKGFTLLEVLMVVAMLAIVGGAIISNYGGLEDKAAKGTATHTIAAVEEAFRLFEATEGVLPDNLETMLAATPDTPTYVPTELDNAAVGTTGTAEKASFLGSKIAGKFTIVETNPAALVAAGITRVRYLDLKGNGTGGTLDIKDADGDETSVGDMAAITIPQHAFEAPRPGDKNRGRGYYVNLVAGTNVPLAIWNAGTNGYNNVKVGAKPTAVLVCLGLGNASTLIGDGVFTNLGHAPFYGNVAKHEYNHYIALIDISGSTGKIIAVLDSRGDFLDEEFAEATGQKL
jgi:prepilin-type N-terminal cleavage/methylation domain-containing protein